MAELLRTQDPALVSLVEGLLGEAGIAVHVADRHMSALEGGILPFRTRLLVPDEQAAAARELLVDAELGDLLSS
ncbi:DUF2007 domain-containing protein [Nocardioides ferulae]|uniref:putative signal transducing protein n=1 Tax=Nocardioides ferulae TaxID=2340821 RepID=UPI000EAC94C4|nr:DUF2007 domain-containing protein [Nocardioides ferulae]